MGRVFMLACVLALGGCATPSGPAVDYIKTEYGAVPHAIHEANGTFLVFDKPAANRLMITPSLDRAAEMGNAHALTSGAADQSHFTKPWSDAAASYLASTGRACRILSTELLVRPQYEVKYECGPARAAPAQKRR